MDETKMMEFVGKAVDDVGAVLGGAMVVIGDKLGLYRSMAGARATHPGGTGRAHRHCGAVCARVVERAGRTRIRVVRRRR